MATIDSPQTVDVICDLRQFGANVDDVGTLEAVWRQVGDALVDEPLLENRSLSIQLPQGPITFWIADAKTADRVQPSTSFRVIDVLRNPRLLYSCRVCGEYGPLRCVVCAAEQKGGDEDRKRRLCSRHAHAIKDELSAYCSDHIPRCNCRSDCKEAAVFRCRRCAHALRRPNNIYGEHFRREHPQNAYVDYCLRCFQALFERCGTCAQEGRRRLGKSKCAFKTRAMESTCGKPLCWDHGLQWKIWGPHNRGITLCAIHTQLLATVEPAEQLYMMLTATPPYSRGRRQSLPGPFRLRRIINRNRLTPLTFEQIGRAMTSISNEAERWGSSAGRNQKYMLKTYLEAVGILPQVESDLLRQVKDFYRRAIGSDASERILRLEVIDQFRKPGRPPRYRVKVYLNSSNKGLFIGRAGAIINQLREQLNIEVDL